MGISPKNCKGKKPRDLTHTQNHYLQIKQIMLTTTIKMTYTTYKTHSPQPEEFHKFVINAWGGAYFEVN